MNSDSPQPSAEPPLRIAICISLFWPEESGAERQARRQAEELVRRGHRVTVITRHRPNLPEEEELAGIAIKRVIRPVSIGPLFGMTFITRLAKYLKTHHRDFDLVHCHQGLWEAAAAGIARGKTGLPSVVQPAAGGPYGEVEVLKRSRGKQLLKKFLFENSCFVAISTQIENELCELGIERQKIHRIGSGVDTDEFSPGTSPLESELPPGPRVLFVGRLHPQKNLERLLDAWHELPKGTPGSLLLLGGDGGMQTALRLRTKRLQLEDRVHFLGAQANVLDYYRASDLFVLPSHSEGMSNALLEAMSCGLPAIVAKTAGGADLVSDRVSGRLIDSKNPTDLANAMSEFLLSEKLRSECGTRARTFILEHYALPKIVDRYERLYRELLRGGE